MLTKSSKLNLWQNSKAHIVTTLKNSNCDKTENLKLWQLKNQIGAILKNSKFDKTQKLKFLLKKSDFDKTKILTKWKP